MPKLLVLIASDGNTYGSRHSAEGSPIRGRDGYFVDQRKQSSVISERFFLA